MTEPRKSPELAGPVTSGSVLISGAAIVDVAAGVVVTGRDVLVIGDRITAVAAAPEAPPGTTVIEARGRFLLPGLWDMHTHCFDADHLPAYLGNGVTGVRQMGAAPVHADWRRRLRAGEVFGPRMAFGSRIIDGPRPSRPGSFAVSTEADARAAVAESADADFLKVYAQLPRAAFRAVLAEAERAGIDVAGHVPFEVPVAEAVALRSIEHLDGLFLGASSERDELTAALAGLDAADPPGMYRRLNEITHRAADTLDPARLAELTNHFLANGTWHVPTLAVHQAKATMGTAEFSLAPYLPHIEPVLRQGWAQAAGWQPDSGAVAREARLFEGYLALTGELHRAGVPLLAGSDTFVPGFSLHDELGLLVRAGLTPAQALRAATLDAARFLGVADRFGTVEPGRTADLVLLNGDPLADIANTRRISGLLFGGLVLDPAELVRPPAAPAVAPASPPAAR